MLSLQRRPKFSCVVMQSGSDEPCNVEEKHIKSAVEAALEEQVPLFAIQPGRKANTMIDVFAVDMLRSVHTQGPHAGAFKLVAFRTWSIFSGVLVEIALNTMGLYFC